MQYCMDEHSGRSKQRTLCPAPTLQTFLRGSSRAHWHLTCSLLQRMHPKSMPLYHPRNRLLLLLQLLLQATPPWRLVHRCEDSALVSRKLRVAWAQLCDAPLWCSLMARLVLASLAQGGGGSGHAVLARAAAAIRRKRQPLSPKALQWPQPHLATMAMATALVTVTTTTSSNRRGWSPHSTRAFTRYSANHSSVCNRCLTTCWLCVVFLIIRPRGSTKWLRSLEAQRSKLLCGAASHHSALHITSSAIRHAPQRPTHGGEQ